MNLGLALAKPGESALGLASRLWQANLASWRLDSTFIDHRIDRGIAQQYKNEFTNLEGNPKGLAAIRAFEQLRFPDIPRARIPKGLRGTEAVRQCQTCAINRYHSLYFNTPWIDECPVHDEPLLTECPACRKAWPNADDVHKRTCDICGIRRNSGSPTRLEMFGAPEYDVVRGLDTFFSQTINTGIARCNHIDAQWTGRTNGVAKALLYPSVLAAHCFGKSSDWIAPVPVEAMIQPCKHKRFKYKSAGYWNIEVTDDQIKKMSRIRQRVIDQALDRIQALADHPIGSCEQDPNNGHYDCVYCDMSQQVTFSIYRHAGRRQPLACHDLIRNRKVRFSDPGLFQTVDDRQSKRVFKIPPSIQWLLYELDVLSNIKQLVLNVQIGHAKHREMVIGDHSESQSLLLGGYASFTNDYSFVVDGEYCHLYYPEEYEDASFSSFENWLSITRTF